MEPCELLVLHTLSVSEEILQFFLQRTRSWHPLQLLIIFFEVFGDNCSVFLHTWVDTLIKIFIRVNNLRRSGSCFRDTEFIHFGNFGKNFIRQNLYELALLWFIVFELVENFIQKSECVNMMNDCCVVFVYYKFCQTVWNIFFVGTHRLH